MTEPDEALLWARERWATMCEQAGFLGVAKTYRRGDRDERLRDDANAYRAGAAASAERIKELELFVAQIAHRFVPKNVRLHYLRTLCSNESVQARALLKEPDQ